MLHLINTLLIFAFEFIIYLSRIILFPPANFPKGIPIVPFWVSTLGFVTKLRQDEIYRQYIGPLMGKEGVVAVLPLDVVWGMMEYCRLKEIYTRTDDFQKSGNNEKIPHSVLAYFLGKNVISARGEKWERFRGILAPCFRQRWQPLGFQECLKDLIESLDRNCELQEPVDVNNLMQRLTMDAIGIAAFGKSFKTLRNARSPISVAHAKVKQSIFRPLFLFFPMLDHLPLPSRVEMRNRIDAMEALLFEAAQRTFAENGSPRTIVGSLMQAYEEERLSRKELRDNLMIIFVAGHENAQQALTSLLYLLARHQDVQEKASLEVANYSVRETSQKLPYLQQILKETLRLCPPIPMLINRRTARNVNLGRFVIPSGTYVGWHAFGVHHSQSVWPDAEEFRPERFHSASTVNRFEWVPFSEGQRRCLGEKLALTEMQTVAAVLLERYRWELPPNANVKMTPGGLFGPVGLRLVFTRRSFDS